MRALGLALLVCTTVGLSQSPLTICTGNRCWRNGAQKLVQATSSTQSIPVRTVGCSGVCPRDAVSVCEGPDCDGPAMALSAADELEAIKSASTAAAALRCNPPMACAAGSDDDIDLLIAEIGAAARAGDGSHVRELVDKLEPLCEVDRCATSPLLDGYWETIFASERPRWAHKGGRMRHAIESASIAPLSDEEEAPLVGSSLDYSPGRTGLRSGPTGVLWEDSKGRGAYVQRSRKGLFGTREVRATYTWLGGYAWELEYVSKSWLWLGIPWRRKKLTREAAERDADLDHALRPTYVDGELLVLRAPAVNAGEVQLRAERLYVLERLRNRLWQDNSYVGVSERAGFEP